MDDDLSAAWTFSPVLICAPPTLFIWSLCDRGDSGYPMLFSLIGMGCSMVVTIGLFFGVSYISAAIPFLVFVWHAFILVHNLICIYGGEGFQTPLLDVSFFLCFLLVTPFIITEIACNMQGQPRDFLDSFWYMVAIAILHIIAIFTIIYINEEGCFSQTKFSKKKEIVINCVISAIYLLPVFPFLIIAILLQSDPFSVWGYTNDVWLYVYVCVTAAFMIAEGILMFCARGRWAECSIFGAYGIRRGICSLLFAAVAVTAISLSLNYAPAVWHIDSISDFQTLARLCNSWDWTSGGKAFYLDCDLDFGGAKVPPISTFHGIFDGQGHTLSNSEDNGYGLFGYNAGTIKDLNIDRFFITDNHLLSYNRYIGTIVGHNNGYIQNCHVTETYLVEKSHWERYSNEYRIYMGGIAGYNSGKIYQCSFVNSNSNAEYPYSITYIKYDYERAFISEIAYLDEESKGALIQDCTFDGTYGTVDLEQK